MTAVADHLATHSSPDQRCRYGAVFDSLAMPVQAVQRSGPGLPGLGVAESFPERSHRLQLFSREVIGASTRSVARATAEALGRRPKDVIDSRVVLEAQRRLAWSRDDIATIARALQFSEASNFTKFFRTRTGVPPSSFRDAVTSN